MAVVAEVIWARTFPNKISPCVISQVCGKKTETTLGISNKGNLILGISYIGDGRAEKPNRKEWENPEISQSRKPLLFLELEGQWGEVYCWSPEVRASIIRGWKAGRRKAVGPEPWKRSHVSQRQRGRNTFFLPWFLSLGLQCFTSACYWPNLPERQRTAWEINVVPYEAEQSRAGEGWGMDLRANCMDIINICNYVYMFFNVFLLISGRGRGKER